MVYKYGYRLRPPALGTEPKGWTNKVGYQEKIDGYWGYVLYDFGLTEEAMFAYDLDLLEVITHE